MYLKETGVNTRNWVDSAQDRRHPGRCVSTSDLQLEFLEDAEILLIPCTDEKCFSRL